MFKETEGMLWRPGDSDPDALRATTIQTSAPFAPPPEPLSMQAPSPMDTVAPPPAIAESGFALGDTEMRRAIRWVQWLQAQGARALGDEPQRAKPSGSLDALLNSPSGASHPAAAYQPPASAPPPAPPVTALPSMPSLPSGALPSGPLPPPSSADLRQMFAELDPDARERHGAGIVEADTVPVVEPEEPATPAFSAPTEWSSSLAEALNQLDDNAGHGAIRATGGPAARAGGVEELATGPMTPPVEPTSAAPDATIEELDRRGEVDGFTPFTLEPGALAAMAGDARGEEARGDDWLETRSPEPPAPEPYAPPAPEPYIAEPYAPELPAPELPAPEPPEELLLGSQPGAPDAHDYAARLNQARDHRDSGALDEAIVEYRTVVRNAPDLLPDVLADVEGCLTERPEHPELHRLLGDARIRQGDYLGALESYNRAVALSQTLDS